MKRSHDFLADILKRVDVLQSSLNPKLARVACSDEQDVPRVMPQPPSIGRRCRNQNCNASMFELAQRDGDLVCAHCGVVQNMHSLESQEEEHRSFADDDKSVSRKRAEVFQCPGSFPRRHMPFYWMSWSSSDIDKMFGMARSHGFTDDDLVSILKDLPSERMSLEDVQQLVEKAASLRTTKNETTKAEPARLEAAANNILC